MVIKFVCEYNGKDFHGFQRQKNLRTAQSVLEEALSKYFCEDIKIVGSGRTDAGVHARGQVCSFQIKDLISTHRKNLFNITAAINAFLPMDISVREFQQMNDDFHAQYSAKSKTYIYKCYISQHRSPLRANTHLQLYKQPDIDKMATAANAFIGAHVFKEFTTDKTDSKDFIRTLYNFDIKQDADEILFIVRGNGFMRNMVRILCGRILDIGFGITQQKIKNLPAHGLVLQSVQY